MIKAQKIEGSGNSWLAKIKGEGQYSKKIADLIDKTVSGICFVLLKKKLLNLKKSSYICIPFRNGSMPSGDCLIV